MCYELVSCKCKKGCKGRCECKKAALKCTDLCVYVKASVLETESRGHAYMYVDCLCHFNAITFHTTLRTVQILLRTRQQPITDWLPTIQGCPGQSRDLTNFKGLSRDPGITQGFHASCNLASVRITTDNSLITC